MSAKSPTVFAIVVNYNGCSDTLECVESLLASDYPDLRISIFDNASSDGSVDKLKAWVLASGASVTIVDCESNLGFAGACNIGLTEVLRRDPSGYALLLNSDATIAKDAISAMVRMADGISDLGAVGATVLRHDRPDVVEMLAGATVNRVTGMVTPIRAGAAKNAPRPDSVRMDYVSGCCLLVRADAIARVGLMDERYFLYSEDVDWGLRMRRAGLRLAYCPRAEVWHKGGATVGHRSPTHDFYMVRGALMLVQKHFAAMLPVALLYWLWRGILPKLARREWGRLRAASRGYLDFLLHAFAAGKVDDGLAPAAR